MPATSLSISCSKRCQYQHVPFLAMLCVVLGLIAPTFSVKSIQMPIGTYLFGPFLGVFFFLAIDVIAEVYGYRTAMKFFWDHFICRFIYSCIFNIFIWLHSPNIAISASYSNLFNDYISSGLIALAVGFAEWFVNIKLLMQWRVLTKGKYFWLRSVGASSVGETLSLYLMIPGWIIVVGISFSQAIHMVFYASFFRIILTAVFATPCVFIANFLKRSNPNNNDRLNYFPILNLKAIV